MHSSRMRIARALTVCKKKLQKFFFFGVGVYLVLWGGVYLVLGAYLVLGVYLVPWGILSHGGCT